MDILIAISSIIVALFYSCAVVNADRPYFKIARYIVAFLFIIAAIATFHAVVRLS